MKWSIGLGIVLGLCLGISSQAIRGAPVPVVPNCDSCWCATSKAWRYTGTAGIDVLTTQPPDNPNAYGDPVSTAHWYGPGQPICVYSAICLQDYHDYADGVTYNRWTVSNAGWNDNCQRLIGQTCQGWTVVAVGTGGSQDPIGTARSYDCGAQ
jgi:hypothetical protein